MHLAELLIGRKALTEDSIYRALDRQTAEGGSLGDNIIALGLLTEGQFNAIMKSVVSKTPALPRTIQETGSTITKALELLLKFMLVESHDTISSLSTASRLPRQIVRQLFEEAVVRKLVTPSGTSGTGLVPEIRYDLSDAGHASAYEGLNRNAYLGPAPVTLAAFQMQIRKQLIKTELLTAEDLRVGLQGLVVPEGYIRKLLPAMNAGSNVLLFGAPGNGKTTVASRIARLFRDVIFIPYAVEIAGQIMRVFDASLHTPVVSDATAHNIAMKEGIQHEVFDDRWVACWRPFVVAGGELTMDMLDLQQDKEAKFYEAPLHLKATNGVFLIDDFGRQNLEPKQLLNRWIGPMESHVDYLKLHTGKSFQVPFDLLLIFSTNIDPQALMDPAFLRRIAYKIELYAPNKADFHRIFAQASKRHGLSLSEEVFEFIVDILSIRGKFGLANFQPQFISEQVTQICRSFSLEPIITKPLASEALANLYVQIERETER